MKTFKLIVKSYATKDGRTFTKAFATGQFIPLALCECETQYTIKFVGMEQPQKDGIYSVAVDDKGLWLDTREEYASKHIVRVRPTRVVYEKPLPTKTK